MARIPRLLVTKMLQHAQDAADSEVCGLISGRNGRALDCYPVANTAANPAHRFEMDPKGQIAALRAMRDRREDLFAIYHSHPDMPAEPSPTDLAQAAYPDALYLIISLSTKGVLEMRGYRIRAEALEAVELEMV